MPVRTLDARAYLDKRDATLISVERHARQHSRWYAQADLGDGELAQVTLFQEHIKLLESMDIEFERYAYGAQSISANVRLSWGGDTLRIDGVYDADNRLWTLTEYRARNRKPAAVGAGTATNTDDTVRKVYPRARSRRLS